MIHLFPIETKLQYRSLLTRTLHGSLRGYLINFDKKAIKLMAQLITLALLFVIFK